MRQSRRSDSVEKRYAAAVTLLRKKLRGKPPGDLAALERALVGQCEGARYSQDKFKQQRDEDKQARASGIEAAKAAKQIARFMGAYPRQGDWIAGLALQTLQSEQGIRLAIGSGRYQASNHSHGDCVWIADGGGVQLSSAFKLLHETLARFLGNQATEPWLHRSSVPGATFPRAIDTAAHKRPIRLSTVLAFHLVLELRAATTPAQPGHIFMIAEGMRMPRTGKPHYQIAQEFVACALKERFDVAIRLREVPDMGYLHWTTSGVIHSK